MKLPFLGFLKNLKLPGAARKTPGFVCINLWPDRIDVSHVVSHVVASGKERPEIKRCDSFRKVGGEAATLTRLRKDLDLGLELGREMDVPMPVTAATREVLQGHFGHATLQPDPQAYLNKDFAALMETMALAAGMKLAPENKNVPTGLEH